METIEQLLEILDYGKLKAKTARIIYSECRSKMNFDHFRRHLRFLSSEARKNGHRVIGDDCGYYKALSEQEWFEYKKRRFASFKDEIESIAKCEKISVRDLIKEVYAVNVDNDNYELNL